MLSTLVFAISFLGLVTIFVRRFKLTRRDLALQDELLKEQALLSDQADMADLPRTETTAHNTFLAEQPTFEDYRQEKIDRFFKSAEEHLQANRLSDAKKVLHHILSLEPKQVEAEKKIGCILLKEGEDKKAEAIFRTVLESHEDPVVYSNLGLALFNQKRFEEAVSMYEKAILLDDSRSARFVSLAHVYHEMGETNKALKNFEQAAAREPRNINYLFIISDYYQQKGESLKVRETLDRILDIEPFNEEAKERLSCLGILA